MLHPDGRLKAVLIDQTPVPISSDLVFPADNWERVYSLAKKSFRITGHQAGEKGFETWRYTGVLENASVTMTTSVDLEKTTGPQFSWSVQSKTALRVSGVYLQITVPVNVFAGGSCSVFSAAGVARAVLPEKAPPDARYLLMTTGRRAQLSLPGTDSHIDLTFPPSNSVILQDNRKWGIESYSILIHIHGGPLPAGESVAASLAVRTTGTLPAQPAVVTVSEREKPRPFKGFGGNYCFQTDTPVTDFTLTKLSSGYLRTELDLAAWEPENDNHDATVWKRRPKSFIARNSTIQGRLKLYQKLQKRGVPIVASVWTGPEWLFSEPGQGFWANGRILPAKNYPEFVECVTSYLLFARRVMGFEPDYFSLNEPALGVRIKLSAQELAALSTQLATAFKRHRITTGLILGDTASPRSLDYVRACRLATPDPAIYTALAVHTWGGASPALWGAWADYSRETGLPLLVTEVGLNGADYTTPWIFNWPDYALNEAALYASLLNQAAVQGTMHWELTPDYAVVTMVDGTPTAHPTRFAQLRQFFNLVPTDARLLRTTVSGNATIKAAALIGADKNRPAMTLHLINLGGGCDISLKGLPASVHSLMSLTTHTDARMKRGKTIAVKANSISIRVPGRSMVSLITPPTVAAPARQ